MATVNAQLNNLRLAPRKVRLIVKMLRGKSAVKALEQLPFLIRRPSDPIAKVLRSAIANATNNFDMVASNLIIKEFWVDEGVKLKRFRAAGFGRAREIQKKTSHIRLILAEKVPGMKGEPTAKKAASDHKHDHAKHDAPAKTSGPKPEIKTELGKKQEGPKGVRKLFQRKSI